MTEGAKTVFSRVAAPQVVLNLDVIQDRQFLAECLNVDRRPLTSNSLSATICKIRVICGSSLISNDVVFGQRAVYHPPDLAGICVL
jgi:hypothetical protein